MDFPLELNKATSFASSIDEFTQDVTILLKNPVRKLFQSISLGSKVPIHGSYDLIEFGVRETIKQIPNTDIQSLSIEDNIVFLSLIYMDEIVNFKFSVEV